ncbi:hypothetical protein JCM1841_004260 [Sporobolomyces salmonicolor]
MSSSTPAALPSHLLHLSTLLLLSRSTDFTHARSLPVHTLSHLLQQYLQLLATTASDAASQAGRGKVAVWDVADALNELGFGGQRGIDELREEADRQDDGVQDEADRIRQLAKGLQDHLAPTPLQLPLAQLSYDPLHPSELALLESLSLQPAEDEPSPGATTGTSASDSEDDDERKPSHQDLDGHAFQIKPDPGFDLGDLGLLTGLTTGGSRDTSFFDQFGFESLDPSVGGISGVGDLPVSVFHPVDTAGRPIPGLELLQPLNFSLPEEGQEEEDARPFPAWKDPQARPDWVPEWLPPFPGQEKASDSAVSQQRRRARERERERERDQLANATNIARPSSSAALGSGVDPWLDPIPYSASMLAESSSLFPNSLPPPSSPHPIPKAGPQPPRKRARRRSLSPPLGQTTSLPAFTQIAPLLPHPPTFLRPSQLRRSAASLISHNPRHPELSISSDSLFGSVPYASPVRQPVLVPGFLPDFAPPLMHPFNTNLPYTVSTPVPYHPSSPSSVLLAPGPNPRVPSTLSHLARELSFPLQFDPKDRDALHPNIALFARLRRIGPPGPLGPKGEALNYEYVGQTALVAMNVDWNQRVHNQKLPRRAGEDQEGLGGAPGETGIKLKLGGGGAQGGRATREGSMSQSRYGSPAPGMAGTPIGGQVGGTPGPSGLSQSQTQANGTHGFDFATSDPLALLHNLDSFPTTTTAATTASLFDFDPTAQPQADFDYPEFLLEGLGGALGTPAAPAAVEATRPANHEAPLPPPPPPPARAPVQKPPRPGPPPPPPPPPRRPPAPAPAEAPDAEGHGYAPTTMNPGATGGAGYASATGSADGVGAGEPSGVSTTQGQQSAG